MMGSFGAGHEKRCQAAESWVRCGEEPENGCLLCVAGNTEVLRTVGEPCENPEEVPGTATKPIEQWLRVQAPITLL